MQFLIDTDCTTNLLSKTTFDKLYTWTQHYIKNRDIHGEMAAGTRFPFHVTLRIPISLWSVKIRWVFTVGNVSGDVTWSVSFLVAYKCLIDFNHPILKLDKAFLECIDWQARLLKNQEQSTLEVRASPRSGGDGASNTNHWKTLSRETELSGQPGVHNKFDGLKNKLNFKTARRVNIDWKALVKTAISRDLTGPNC